MKRSPPSLLRFAFFSFAALVPAAGKPAAPMAEYKRTDTNYYLGSLVLKADPSALILDTGEYHQKGDSYFIKVHHKAPSEIYIATTRDWLEPVTPPSMPVSLGILPDVMQIRETQGDVSVVLPSGPGTYVPATEEMPIPNGTLVKTGPGGTTAVLFGGVDSVRLAPNSEAVVEQEVTPQLRSTKVDVKSGVVFSKVGLRPEEKQDYRVHTPFGTAVAKGTDFACVVMPDRTDVWIAQGTVEFDKPDGETVAKVKSPGTGALRLIRFPAIEDPRRALLAGSESLTLMMNFIPTVDLKIKGLREEVTEGVTLTTRERKYLDLLKHVPCLLRLTLVPSPASPHVLATAPPSLTIQAHALMTPRVDGVKPATGTAGTASNSAASTSEHAADAPALLSPPPCRR